MQAGRLAPDLASPQVEPIMFPSPDTHLRVLILEREIELKRAERQDRFDSQLGGQQGAARLHLGALVGTAARRLADAVRPGQRFEPVTSR